MIVRQKYVGWLGVCINKVVVNSGIIFTANIATLMQLEEVNPNPLEVELLLECVKKNNPIAQEHIVELEEYLIKNPVIRGGLCKQNVKRVRSTGM